MTNVADRSMSFALRNITRVAGSDTLDRIKGRKPMELLLYRGTRDGFKAIAAAGRTFSPPKKSTGKDGARLKTASASGQFDLTPDDEQQFLIEAVSDFAANRLRTIAHEAEKDGIPQELLDEASELGLTMLGVPEEAGGAVSERSAVTGVLVAEALAYGDAGLAVALMAPAAVATAIASWGDADQQEQYLAPFVSDDIPVAALALAEPQSLADPLKPQTTAKPIADGYVLNGVKALVPRGADCELLIVGATIENGGPALFIVETSRDGVLVTEDPAMGLKAAKLGRIKLDNVTVPATALLGKADPAVYSECVSRSQLAWAAIGSGLTKAVRDFVAGYVNERVAFGEPISHRQAVAFMVSDIAIEHEGLRLTMLRAAARADAGSDYRREVTLARTLARKQGMTIGSQGVQLLGGHGYIDEYPVERWYRDLRAVGVLDGIVLV
jgi:alkylation response protein AidB-like acyl-CoA dehydrogenase